MSEISDNSTPASYIIVKNDQWISAGGKITSNLKRKLTGPKKYLLLDLKLVD